jgi:ubiquinone/menaquinone biosynthesis C-methylase UbiE
MFESKLFHPSSKPAGHGITIGTPLLYDLSAPVFFFGTRRRSYKSLMAAAGVNAGNRVLDIGCGPGYFVRMLAGGVGPTGYAVGIDAAPEMIEYARRKARRLSNCRFESGSAEALPFPDASFEVVVSSLMLHHLPDGLRLQAATEMKRVLRPGGVVLLADFAIPERGAWHLLAAITGHAGGQMIRRVSPVEPLVAEAGFAEPVSGEAPPWLHYVRAIKP